MLTPARTTPVLKLVAALLLTSIVNIPTTPVMAQVGACFPGRDCCVVGMSLDTPRRYAVGCDGGAQTAQSAVSASGNPIVVFGPTTWERAGAWMNRAGIPGWSQYAGVPLEQSAVPPPPDSSCFLGRNCCWVGSTYDTPPRFAIGYDGNAGRGDIALSQQGFHHIAHGPVSTEFCHAWWNANVAARGLGPSFPTGVIGAIPAGQASLRAPPPAGPSGPQGPRPTAGGATQIGISVSLSPSAWVRVAPHIGNVSASNQGLILGGGAWTNGQVREGRIDGNRVTSQEIFDFSAGGDVYMAFAVNGGGKYMGFYPRLVAGLSVRPMSTGNSWAGSIVVPEDTLLFGHLRIEAGGSYRLTIAQGSYDERGGQLLQQEFGQLATSSMPLELHFLDNYAGEAAGILVAEAWVYPGGSAPQSAVPAPAKVPSGGLCGTDAECPGSVCLLGTCVRQSPPRRF
jgi:hypothetical protein